jgi:hypothetical protein
MMNGFLTGRGALLNSGGALLSYPQIIVWMCAIWNLSNG